MVYYIPTAQILQHINFIKPATPAGFLGCGCPPTGVRGERPRSAVIISEGFLFVATKRNPSDSKEKNAFWVAMVGTRGIVFTQQVVVSSCYP